eukprot:472512_1
MIPQKRKKESDQPSDIVDVKCVLCRQELKYRSLKQHYWTHGKSYSYPDIPFMTIENESNCMWIGPPDKKRKIFDISQVKYNSFTSVSRAGSMLNAMQGAQHIFSINNSSTTSNKFSYNINCSIKTPTKSPFNKLPKNIISPHLGNAFGSANYAKKKQKHSSNFIVPPLPKIPLDKKHNVWHSHIQPDSKQN